MVLRGAQPLKVLTSMPKHFIRHWRGVIVSALLGVFLITGSRVPAAENPAISIQEWPTITRVYSKSSGAELLPGVELYNDGRCVLRTFRGEEIHKSFHRAAVVRLLKLWKRQGLFSISSDAIEKAKSTERQRRTVVTDLPDGSFSIETPPIRTTPTDMVQMRITARTETETVLLSVNGLLWQIESFPAIREYRTMRRCVNEVYKVTGNPHG